MGISTGRLQPRGPVGVEGLLSYKWIMCSTAKQGHIVSDFSKSIKGDQSFNYTHVKRNK